MVRALPLTLLALATAAAGQPDDEDAAHRADRLRTEQLNRQALETSRPRMIYHDHDRRDYDAARKQYERELTEWRERVAACRAGDWSACE